jgi:putative Holliday junction resolvase
LDTILLRKPGEWETAWRTLAQLTQTYDIGQVVLGLPIRMDGQEGAQAQKVRAFGEALAERFALPITWLDERYTSVIAQQALRAQGIAPSRNKARIDQAAAQIILQNFLDSRPPVG